MVNETFERLGYVEGHVTPDKVLSQFNGLLYNVWRETLVTLEKNEDNSFATGIPREFIQEFPDKFSKAEEVAKTDGFRQGAKSLFGGLYPMFRRAFLSVQQGRMARGGSDFELYIEGLFDLAGIPYHP